MVNAYAAFDILYVCAELGSSIQKPALAEVHVLTYLACLLSLYRGQPAADWGYSFAGTKDGSPFSPEIDTSVRTLISTGFLRSADGDVGITPTGISELATLREFHQNKDRIAYLEPACSSTLTMPVGVIRHALTQEPTLKPTS